VILFTASTDAARRAALERCGAEIVDVPAVDGRLDPAVVLANLAARHVNELHVEAGARLNGALLRTGQVDELLLYLAPLLLGAGREMAALGPFEALAQGMPFDFHDAARVGADLRILARNRPVTGTP